MKYTNKERSHANGIENQLILKLRLYLRKEQHAGKKSIEEGTGKRNNFDEALKTNEELWTKNPESVILDIKNCEKISQKAKAEPSREEIDKLTFFLKYGQSKAFDWRVIDKSNEAEKLLTSEALHIS